MGFCVQITLPNWPGRLPLSLTQLVISPLDVCEEAIVDEASHLASRAESCTTFSRMHLPPLRSLRHLALHGLVEVGQHHLRSVCTAAAALPQLISLHLVRSVPCCQCTASARGLSVPYGALSWHCCPCC